MPHIVPVFAPLARLLEDIRTDRVNQPQILRQRYKIRRSNQSQFPGIPADQRLRTHARIGFPGHIHDRLIDHLKLGKCIVGRIAHIFFHIEAAERCGLHVLIVELHTVLAGTFCGVKRNIRLLDQLLHRVALCRETHNAHTHRTVVIRPLKHPRLGKQRADVIQNLLQHHDLPMCKNNDKLISAHAVTVIFHTRNPTQAVRYIF